MHYGDRVKSCSEASSQRTTSRGRKESSWRKTSSPTVPPMGVALSKATTSSWVRPFRSTPFTWTGGGTVIGLNSRLVLKKVKHSNLIIAPFGRDRKAATLYIFIKAADGSFSNLISRSTSRFSLSSNKVWKWEKHEDKRIESFGGITPYIQSCTV